MENNILGGIVLVIVVVGAVAGVLVFNSMNPKTTGVINPIMNNQSMGNNTTNTDEINLQSPSTLFTFKFILTG